MKRQHINALVVLLALLSVGCLGSGGLEETELAKEETYNWETNANATITIERNSYKTVYTISNQSTIELYRFQRLNNRRALEVSAVQFRFPNGTVVGPAAMTFDQNQRLTTITLPAINGQLAFSAPKRGKNIRVASVIDGSYEVILPPNGRVDYYLLGRVHPGGYDQSNQDGITHLYWDEIEGDRIVVEYYLVRDLWLFSGLVLIAAIVLIGGSVFFWIRLREVRDRRKSVGLDVESDDSGRS